MIINFYLFLKFQVNSSGKKCRNLPFKKNSGFISYSRIEIKYISGKKEFYDKKYPIEESPDFKLLWRTDSNKLGAVELEPLRNNKLIESSGMGCSVDEPKRASPIAWKQQNLTPI